MSCSSNPACSPYFLWPSPAQFQPQPIDHHSPCYRLGQDLANQPQFIKEAKQHPDQIQSLCYYLEKQPFQLHPPHSTTEPFPTTDCARENIHLGCVQFLQDRTRA